MVLTSQKLTTLPFSFYVRTASGETPIAQADDDWELVESEEPWPGPGKQVLLRLTWHGSAPTRAGLVARLPLGGTAKRVMIPGLVYGDNGPGSATTRYPHPGPLDASKFTSPAWDFASERTPCPAAFAWVGNDLPWLAVEPGGTGIGFSTEEDDPYLSAHCPGLERPFRHDRVDEAPFEPLTNLAPGSALELRLWYGQVPAAEPTAFASVQRALQSTWSGSAGRQVNATTALGSADMATDGLLRWHYDPEHHILMEAVSFDRSMIRTEMHVGWVSGAPTAYALLRHGLTRDNEDAAQAARSVLDTVASGLAPCGAFWGIWTPNGWRAGWNGHPSKLHARTLAEATLFLLRALAMEPDHRSWEDAARSNLDFCLRSLDEQGNPGSYYDAHTGDVLDRRGTAGLLWAAALVEASDVLDSHRYLDAARKIAASYADDIRSGSLMGAPEDIGLCPSSEDTYNALISMMALWQATNEKQWLELARLSADWLLTYRWTYDVRFPAGTPLQKRHFRTLGGDLASPSNNHLHMYGLICQQELFELSRALEDPWYAERALDHLACFVGEVATRNGQFGGAERKGMASEQWYTVDWSREGRAGEIAPVSHAWCLGLLILAIEEWADYSLSPISLPRLEADGGQRLRGDARIRASWRVRQAAHGLQVKPNPPSRRRSTHEQVQSPVRVDSPHVVRLLPGFYQVGGGYLSHWRDAASYLLVDEQSGDSLMIDCGSHAGLAAVRANISAVADINKVKLVIGTHCHWDHVEAFGHLREETDALFAVHALDARAVRTGDPDLTCAGFLYNEVFHPFPVDITLSGGERFYIGEYDLEIIHLPGHAPGCIGVMMHYERTDQMILVPGDSVSGAFAPKIKSNLKHWKHSVRSLMSRKIDFMVPNHLPPGSQTSLLVDVPHRLAKIYNQLDTDFYNFADPQRA